MTLIHRKVLLTLSDTTHLEAWLNLAAHLVPEDGEIHVRGLVTVPEELSLSEGANMARQWREALDMLAQNSSAVFADRHHTYVDYKPIQHVLKEITTASFDLLIVQWAGPAELTGGGSTNDILDSASCDVILLHGYQFDVVGPVLLSLRGGPNLTLGTRVAKALANGSTITLFHAVDRKLTTPELANLEVTMRDEPQITRTIATSKGLVEGILSEATTGHKAIVLGAGFRESIKRRNPLSPVIKRVFEQTQMPIAIVRAYNPEDLEFHPPRKRTIVTNDLSTRVDRWFAENTFDSGEFADLNALMALKEKHGVTISVGLPALNEEKTVGKVIKTLKSALMNSIPLVDEIVLIDSNSTDNTVAIAESLGIPVYKHPDILPEVGSYRGKGEALWKSLHVLKGDIIAWVDTDITNIHPRFIYGIIGPLLKYPRLQYVKGYYQRPIKVNGKLQAYGGGRVTELVARPMLNLFYPELSGIIQPLSGEYAGRRTALEQVPFFTGYGVETALLIDLHQRFGLEGLAQTDLEVRVHHNQPLVGLSKMSFAILQVFIDRIEKRYGTQLLEMANRSMKLIVHEPDRFGLEIQDITDIERPPMISVPAYAERLVEATVTD